MGEESGDVYYYSVEWPSAWEVQRHNWSGAMTLLAHINAHSQQICGLAWSSDGSQFATGGNDNLCCLFNTSKIFESEAHGGSETKPTTTSPSSASQDGRRSLRRQRGFIREHDGTTTRSPASSRVYSANLSGSRTRSSPPAELEDGVMWQRSIFSHHEAIEAPSYIVSGTDTASIFVPRKYTQSIASQTWPHLAAVKAMAFCPWRPHLLATGGGSTDKMIHFYHTPSGATLATICVNAQVTSLTWSPTRRELAATFGYAQPEHPIRIATFSWPECKMVGSVRWEGEHRALFAVPYPGGPDSPKKLRSRGAQPSGPDAATHSSIYSGESAARWGGERHSSRKTARDGSLVVLCSDGMVKFHEVWGKGHGRTTAGGSPGALGGSDILEMCDGIDKDGDVIR